MTESSDKEKEFKNTKKKKKTKKKLGYFYLFVIVFFLALACLSYAVKSFSPDVDVAIGNNDSMMTLSDSDIGVEIKSVDERLKWIQMEDDMPTVAVREPSFRTNTNLLLNESEYDDSIDNDINKKEEKTVSKKVISKPPAPSIKDIQIQKSDFRTLKAANPEIIPLPKPLITRVYLGNFTSIDEAMNVQNKVSAVDDTLMPFVKAINDYYIVQVGSFSDSAKAEALAAKLKQLGYNPKINYEN